MRFFTPSKYVALQNLDAYASDAADAAWEEAVAQYDAFLQKVRPQLPPRLHELVDGHSYHDAEVLSMGRQGNRFVIVLQLDEPPHDLLTFTYTLAGEPQIERSAFPPEYRQTRPLWLYEELEVIGSGTDAQYWHSILFSNGWEVRLPFRHVELTTASPVFPLRDVSVPHAGPISQPA